MVLNYQIYTGERQCEDIGGNQPSASQEEKSRTDSLLMTLRRKQPYQHLDLGFPAFRTVRKQFSVV